MKTIQVIVKYIDNKGGEHSLDIRKEISEKDISTFVARVFTNFVFRLYESIPEVDPKGITTNVYEK